MLCYYSLSLIAFFIYMYMKCMQMYILFIVTVQANPLAKEVTLREVEDIIKSWLRNAADRDNGRDKRRRI